MQSITLLAQPKRTEKQLKQVSDFEASSGDKGIYIQTVLALI